MVLLVIILIVTASVHVCRTFCQECPPGNYITADGDCQPCIAGSSQPLPNQTSCIPCEDGLVSTTNSSTVCVPCGQNEMPSMFHNRCVCIDGYARHGGSTACVPCPPGSRHFASEFDRQLETCFLCSANEFQPDFGQSECLPCPEGTRSAPGSDQCVPCDMFTCGNCPEFHSSQFETCVLTDVPTPRPRSDGAFEQVLCAGRFGTPVDISQCLFVACPDGTGVMSDGSCGTCSPGTFYNRTAYECQPCALRQFMDEQNVFDSCFECAGDSFSLPGASECMKCPLNQALMADGNCATCKPGTFYNERELRCEPCPPNTFSRGGVHATNQCIGCPSFSFAGSDTCRPGLCPRGTAPMKETGQCGTCPPGKEYNRASASCERCTDRISFEPTVKGNFGLFGCTPCFRGVVDADRTMCNVSPSS